MKSRIGLSITTEQHQRLTDRCDHFNVTQSELLAAMTTVLTDDEVKSMLDRYAEVQALETEMRTIADRNMLTYLRGRTPAELKTMVLAARTAMSAVEA